MKKQQIIILNFNWEAKDMRGKVLGNMGFAIGEGLQNFRIPQISSEKATDWAALLFAGGSIQVDKSDYKQLRAWCCSEKNPMLKPIVTRRLNEFFNDVDKKYQID